MVDVVDPKLTLLSGIPGQWEGGAGIIVVNGTIGGATVDLSFSDDGSNYIAIGSQLTATGAVVFAAPRNSWLKAVVAGGAPTLTIKVYREAGLHAFVQTQAGTSSGGPSSDVNIASFGASAITKGQKTKAGSMPVVLASDSDALQFTPADMLNITGTIGSAAVLSNFPKTDCTGYHSITVQFTVVTAGNTAVVEESNDGTTWSTLTSVGGSASVTAVGLHIYNFSAKQVRVRCSVWASGSVTVDTEFRALKTVFPLAYGAGAVDTRTQRSTLASDDPAVVSLAAILAKLNASVAVTGTFWQASQPVTIVDGGSVTLGSKADAKSTATDTTAITIMQVLKQVSFSIQAAATSLALFVFGAGTAAAAQRVTLASDDPAVATLGATSGAKVITDANGTIQQYLRGLVTQWIAGTLVIGTGTNSIGNVGHGKTIKTATVNISADNDIIAAVTSKRIKVIAYALFKTGTNANPILFKSNGTGGTELARVLLQSQSAAVFGANLAIPAPSFLFATAAGEKLTMDVGDADTITGFITYFDDDAT